MTPTYTRTQLLAMTKKQVIRACGYKNMKQLCKAAPDLIRSRNKGPSKKTLIKIIQE